MGVEMERDIAEDLVSFKLRQIHKEIEIILSRWNYTSSDQFIEDVKTGKIIEGENDAIDLRHLVEEETKLSALYQQITG